MLTITITTKYAPRPNSNNGKIIAEGGGKQKSTRYDQSASIEGNHRAAAVRLLHVLHGADAERFSIVPIEGVCGAHSGWTWEARVS